MTKKTLIATPTAEEIVEFVGVRGQFEKHSPVLVGVGTDTPHLHHWHIEEAHGPLSVGTCSCGAVRQFRNWDKEHDYVTSTEARIGC